MKRTLFVALIAAAAGLIGGYGARLGTAPSPETGPFVPNGLRAPATHPTVLSLPRPEGRSSPWAEKPEPAAEPDGAAERIARVEEALRKRFPNLNSAYRDLPMDQAPKGLPLDPLAAATALAERSRGEVREASLEDVPREILEQNLRIYGHELPQ